MSNNDTNFRPKARIILQLGDQLIRSESIAVLELIKNSYDACAKKVTIRMKNIENPDQGQIIIEDDGYGMDHSLIKNVWLTPGTTHKKVQIEKEEFIGECNRVPLGEKGIGRFGAHKLGQRIEMISKKADSQEAHLIINWEDFDNDDMLDKVPISLTERNPEVFTDGKTGTKIIISGLRSKWTRGAVRSMYRAINSLNSPFESTESFKVVFKTDRPNWLGGLLSFKDIKDSALFIAEATLKDNEIKTLNYEFVPWATMKELQGREYTASGVSMVQKEYDEEAKKKIMKDIDLSDHKIGEIKLKLLIFDLDSNVLSLGVQDKQGLKSYLKDNGGVRVYRDGVRVYDYGEPGNDWLSLDLERVNLPAARLSNNIVIGAVSLDRLASKDLIEKTNREGFIENDAFRTFYAAIRFTISQVVAQRNIDKDKIRSHYSKGGGKQVPVADNLEILRQKVEDNLTPGEVKTDILRKISEIEDDYKTISEVYIRSASAGLSLSIVVHEIEKIVQEMLYVVEESKKADAESERIKNLTWHMGKLIDGYSGLIRRRSRKESDLKQVVRQALWNISYRIKAHKVEVIDAWKEEKKFETRVRCSDGLVVGTIINIIDNSIWWLDYGKVQKKKLWIDVTDELPGFVTIILADNGPGFTLPTEDVIKPFISNKDGGIGIGLHIAYEIMNSQHGELLFPSPDQFTIPEEFRAGAIVALAFKLNEK
ncbi:histidine kinase/DNA gyrase B/HSP90-like ATPase [Pontibacter mucosus]|uniref:Histidine kinase/DNA gyrase B/HSP90-like ATPase n=1 Tax=Pontibacter mucosus TaxID=1649266 RepID=A0A2T5YDV0_9BACT|nr:ATP-binding protein [Pontibacter mucosus]PTX14721.1 histidine kinase/DNA gyrase B/HSP90-like ATPase [Pontibacter mucosus]